MKTFDLLSMCVRNLLRRKMRTLLTILGVVIGTCAIIVTVSLGLGMTKIQNDALAQMGDLTKIQIYNRGSGSSGEAPVLDDKALKKISTLEGVDVATPLARLDWGALEIWSGDKYQYSDQIIGIYPDAMEKLGYKMKEGKYLTEGTKKKVHIVFGEQGAYQFYNVKKNWASIAPYPDAKGKIADPYVNVMKDELTMRLGRQDTEKTKLVEYEVVVDGILVADNSKGWETQSSVFMPIDEMNRLSAEYKKLNKIKENKASQKGYQNAVVMCTDIKHVEGVENYIKEMGFSTNSMESIRKPMQKQIQQNSMVLGGLGLISLVVAAIGITNTMVMSIYERTREIGIMKVLGCEVPSIRAMFLTEAGIIGLLGGIAGTAISFGISWCMNNWETIKSILGIVTKDDGGGMGGILGGGILSGAGGGGQISVIPPWLVLVAVLFGILIGLVSGFAPANRAVKISALEAIKHD